MMPVWMGTLAGTWRTISGRVRRGPARVGMAGLLGLTLLLAGQAPVGAQATRTWVSGVGDDVASCARTAPCKTFAGAISKTATGGEINVLDSGGFGAVTITKSISIVADGLIAGVAAPATNGIVVNAPTTADVVLRGLDIDGFGSGLNGIRYLQGRSLFIENVTLNGFVNGRAAIDASMASAGELYVVNSDVRNSVVGMRVISTSGLVKASVDGSRFENNQVGIWADNNSRVTVRDSVVSGNTFAGFQALPDVALAELSIEKSNSIGNGTGVRAGNGTVQSVVRMAATMVYGNGTGLSIAANSQILSFGNNMIFGNNVAGPAPGSIPLQ